MTFNELVEKVRERAKATDVSGIDFLAVQINITGDNGGVFYLEAKDGNVNVEPYDYHDRSCGITLNQDNFIKLMNGKLDPVAAFTAKKLTVDGDVGKALEFSKLIKK